MFRHLHAAITTRFLVTAAVLATLIAAFGVVPGAADSSLGPLNAAGRPVFDARLRYLLAHRNAATITPTLQALVPVSLRFVHPPDAATLTAVTHAGARFHVADPEVGDNVPPRPREGRRSTGIEIAPGVTILGGRTVFPADVARDDLERLAALPGIERIETSWSPQPRQAPLYRTRQMIGAEATWSLSEPQYGPVLGTGVIIADLDTGVDVFHPDLWRDDGPAYSWLDRDASTTITDGDAVDLDNDGIADPGETLRWFDAPGNAPGQSGTQNPAVDHLYVDTNGNGVRDFGPPAFSESAPTYGERVFRGRDLDHDGAVEPGEPVVELHSCKVLAVYQTDGVVRRRGVDLINNEGDTYGHGTNVSSIMVGGEPGRRFGGIAPGASLLMATLAYGPDPPFVSPFEVRMAWAASEGADVMLYEDGEWIWLFLDGSSNVEQLINEYAEAGIIQAVAAGNLATGNMHWQGSVGPASGDRVTAELTIWPFATVTKAWQQIYWIPRPGETVEVELEAPTGEGFTIGGPGTTRHLADFDVWHATDVSPRGTVRVDVGLTLSAGSSRTNVGGTWRFTARRTSAAASPLTVHGMCWDELSGWSGYSNWTGATMASTVTWPATADSAIVVAAFDPDSGSLNNFSGRGPRVDGRAIVDVAAPGSISYTGRRRQDSGGVPGGYASFGGTSGALPHVAASCALLRQWLPNATHGVIRRMLHEGAMTDAQTGAVPNHNWGYGKLNVYQAALRGLAAVPPARTTAPAIASGPALAPGAPNPFSRSTEIRYALPREGEVTADIYDLAGRLVARLVPGRQPAGEHTVRWDGADRDGRPAGSGVYLVQVSLDGNAATRKVARIR